MPMLLTDLDLDFIKLYRLLSI